MDKYSESEATTHFVILLALVRLQLPPTSGLFFPPDFLLLRQDHFFAVICTFSKEAFVMMRC
jgi:hypothetical protein